jgi:hypothetical protein
VAQITKALGFSVEPWVRALQGTQFAATDRVELVTVFNYIEFCLTQIVQDNELGALREVGAGRGRRAGAGLARGVLCALGWAGLAWRLLRQWAAAAGAVY